MKVTRKLIISSLLILVVIIFGVVSLDIFTTLSNANQREEESLKNLENTFSARIEALEAFAIGLALEVANNPEVQAAFAAGDRARLIELTLPSYQVINAQFDVPQHQFHLPPATSFLRLHQLDQFGDDLSSFRFTVLAANELKQPLAGIEIGRGGLGVRGVAPVSYQGEHIGTVEFGLNVDERLLKDLQDQFGNDWQIFLRREPAEIATFIGATEDAAGPVSDLVFQASTFDSPLFGQSEAYDKALQGEAAFSESTRNDRTYTLYSTPLLDYSSNVIGVLDIVVDRTPVVQGINNRIFSATGVLLLALVLIGSGLAFVATRTLHPIAELEKSAAAIAQGDLNQVVKVNSKDELGALATTFNNMTAQLRSLVGSLEQQVTARTQALTATAEVSRYLSTILDPHELVLQVVEQVKEAFNYYHAHIYLLAEDGKTLKMVGGTGEVGQTLLERGHTVSIERGLVGQAARTRQTVLVPDTGADANWLPNPLLPDTQSEIAVPIIYGDVVLGVLDVQQNIVNGLNEEDKKLLESIARQAAIALQNASVLERSRQNAEALRESQQLFETILETAPIPFLISRISDARVLYANRQYGELFHLPMDQLIGYPTPDFYDDPSDRANILKKVQADGFIKDHEFLAKRTDGTRLWVSISIQPIMYEKNPALLAAIYDLTERKASEETLKRRAERDRVLNRISTKIRGAASMEQILQVAVQEVRHATHAARSTAIIDPNEDTMSLHPLRDETLPRR